MPDTSRDPADRERTTRRYAGESMKNGRDALGLVAIGAAVAALAIGLVGFATGHLTVGIMATVLVAMLAGAGMAWIRLVHRSVRVTNGDHRLTPKGNGNSPRT